jgi:hypothetical protein
VVSFSLFLSLSFSTDLIKLDDSLKTVIVMDVIIVCFFEMSDVLVLEILLHQHGYNDRNNLLADNLKEEELADEFEHCRDGTNKLVVRKRRESLFLSSKILQQILHRMMRFFL